MPPLRAIEELAAQHARERDLALTHERDRKRAHGIVHTPPELARLVVRVADRLLRERLHVPAGACDARLLALDPACGPGAFFAAMLALTEDRAGVESAALHALGCDLDAGALALARRLTGHPAGAGLVFEQADALASDVAAQHLLGHAGPVLVLGNPPWASVRSQLSAADQTRLEAFRRDAEGVRLPERKLGVLSDAYVRFFALCSELAGSHAQGGVVALVSNASYLDGPVHRGMRARLLAAFEEVYVLDLGGSALLGRTRERRDDNVFGVRPGVAVTWLCRYPDAQQRRLPGRVFYARMFGTREEKLAQLSAAGAHELEFQPLESAAPQCLYLPRPRNDARYSAYPALADWLPFQREGVQSNRDAMVVDHDRGRLLARLRAFCRGEDLPELQVALTALHHYDPGRARRALEEAFDADPDGTRGRLLQPIAYRPLDERVFCPVTPLCHRPRPELAQALAFAPAALISVRKDRGDLPWTHASWAMSTVDNCYLSARSSCRARAFPLRGVDGEPNLAPPLAAALGEVLGEAADVEQFAYYALCILSADAYRERWNAELHLDYPRIPLPKAAALFHRLAEQGRRLAVLLASPCATELSLPTPDARAHYAELDISEADGCIRLEAQTLLAVSPGALRLRVGHHRPLHTYLASRARWPLDAAGLQAVCARAERLQALWLTQQTTNRLVAELFAS